MIGAGKVKSGAPIGSTAMKTGSKTGTGSTIDAKNTTNQIFQGLHEIYKDKSVLKTDKATDAQRANDLWKTYRSGDKSVAGELLKTLEPTINAALTNMVGGDQRYLTRARIMALQALPGFDPSQGVALNTFIYNRLQSLRRLSADRGNFIHVPERSALERRQLEAIKNDYMLETGMEPSLAMLADRSGMPLNKVGRLMSIFGSTTTSAVRGEHGDSLEHKKRDANELYLDTFYNELPEIDKKIYEWSTGYKGSPQLDRATMAKRLGISEAAISQHAGKIDRKAAEFNRTLTDTIYGKETE
jgi:DNA-directed RNA polymerase specialized sigma subunit